MNVIILTHDIRAPGSLTPFGNPVNFVVATTAGQLPGRLAPGMWWIVRRDAWQYDERVVSALHTLSAFPDVEMIDPTGLLGGSRYGAERNALADGVRPPLMATDANRRAIDAKLLKTKTTKRRRGPATERNWQ